MMQRVLSYSLLAVLLVTVLGACGPTGNNVEVKLSDFAIDASRSDFKAGETYTFTITNEGAVPHEFVISKALEEGEMHMEEGMGMEHEGLVVEVEEDELPPGATVTVDATFPSTVPDYPLEYGCHIEGHYEAGMHSPITLE
jgi:uncharacterized cupredoxin-like copper-binding protein